MSETSPTVHALKTAPPYYDAVASGMKTFDIRFADRPYAVGDNLVLREYVDGQYTGRSEQRIITYVMDDPDYVLPGSVVLGIRPLEAAPDLCEASNQDWQTGYVYKCMLAKDHEPASEEWPHRNDDDVLFQVSGA